MSGPGPDEARALQQGGPVPGQVAQRHRVAADVRLDVLHEAPDARHRLDELVGDGRVERQAGEVVVHELGEQRERRHRVDEVVQEELLALLGVGLGLADDRVGHRAAS